jgi:hypothetical protein
MDIRVLHPASDAPLHRQDDCALRTVWISNLVLRKASAGSMIFAVKSEQRAAATNRWTDDDGGQAIENAGSVLANIGRDASVTQAPSEPTFRSAGQ